VIEVDQKPITTNNS